MSDAADPTTHAAPGWTRWRMMDSDDRSADRDAVRDLPVRAFRFILVVAIAGLSALVLQGVLEGGPFPWVDLLNLAFFLMLPLALARWPDRLRLLAWLGLLSLFLNALDGLLGSGSPAIVPAHVLLPLLVLYGALFGDLSMSLAAMVFVLSAYAAAGIRAWPLSRPDLRVLLNLSIVTVTAGLAVLGIWIQHRKLLRTLDARARDLRRELDARLRLHAVLFHDINNPLSAIVSIASLLKTRTGDAGREVDIIGRMAARIQAIIRSAHGIEGGGTEARSVVSVASLHEQLQEVFSFRLSEKEVQLLLHDGALLRVRTDPQLLCNSILSNIVNNAVKFAPRGSAIGMHASPDGDRVRIEFRDRGCGFPDDILQQASSGQAYRSQPGSEGETGSGHGLLIAALFLQQLDGFLEVRNLDGGAAVSVLLPAA